MSSVNQQIKTIRQKLRRLRQRELREPVAWKRRLLAVSRWTLLLQHEYVRDDVRIRAESLSFLMIFSLLPLLAGGFFLFSVFAQFGMVQESIQDLVQRFLVTIPEAHRAYIEQYVLQFKDAYLANLAQKSGSIGIFALLILIWIGLQTFNNVDRTLNRIWGAERERPFLEKARNFVVVSVAAPIALLSALSLPHILQKLELSRSLVESVPAFLRLLNGIIVPTVLFATFACLYRFVPVRRVQWRSAFAGAAFATVGLELSNVLMGFYFRFGTNSAYGKAAVIPLIGFWIYVVWVIVIMGAEFSFLMQNQRDILQSPDREPSLREGHALVLVLTELLRAQREARIPISFERIAELTGLESARARALVNYLREEKFVVECVPAPGNNDGAYALARDIAEVPVGETLRRYFDTSWDVDRSPITEPFAKAFGEWLASFGTRTVAELPLPSDEPSGRRRRAPKTE